MEDWNNLLSIQQLQDKIYLGFKILSSCFTGIFFNTDVYDLDLIMHLSVNYGVYAIY